MNLIQSIMDQAGSGVFRGSRVVASESGKWLGFVQIPPFDRQWDALNLSDEDLRSLEVAILSQPDRGAVIPGGNGLRKIRFAKAGSGKSGGYRTFYLNLKEYGYIIL